MRGHRSPPEMESDTMAASNTARCRDQPRDRAENARARDLSPLVITRLVLLQPPASGIHRDKPRFSLLVGPSFRAEFPRSIAGLIAGDCDSTSPAILPARVTPRVDATRASSSNAISPLIRVAKSIGLLRLSGKRARLISHRRGTSARMRDSARVGSWLLSGPLMRQIIPGRLNRRERNKNVDRK